MPRIIGLDFGTTNTRIHLGYVDRTGQVAVVDLPESDRGSLPTVIIVSEAGALQGVGRQAEKALQNPSLRDSVRFEFKPCLGRGQHDLEAQTAGLTLELKCPECGAKIPEGFRFCGQCGKPLPDDFKQTVAERALRYEREDAFGYAELLLERVGGWLRERTLGGGWEGGDTVVVGVPVHWSDQTRQEYADLVGRAFATEHIQVVDEPHAALAEYLSRAGAEVRAGEQVLVVDVGGGTTDLVAGTVREDGTLVEVRRHGIRYGGADFDDAIVGWAMKQLGPQDGLSEDQLAGALRPYCRELKEQLSDAVKSGLDGGNPSRSTMVAIPPSLMTSLDLDRARFEDDEVAGKLLGYLGTALDESLRQMGLRAEDLGHVLLIGGGSNLYFVEDLARRVFPQAKVVVGQQPELAISRGLVVAVSSAISLAPPEAAAEEPEGEATPPSHVTAVTANASAELAAAGEYVRKARASGRTDDAVRAALERAGWGAPVIAEILGSNAEEAAGLADLLAPESADSTDTWELEPVGGGGADGYGSRGSALGSEPPPAAQADTVASENSAAAEAGAIELAHVRESWLAACRMPAGHSRRSAEDAAIEAGWKYVRDHAPESILLLLRDACDRYNIGRQGPDVVTWNPEATLTVSNEPNGVPFDDVWLGGARGVVIPLENPTRINTFGSFLEPSGHLHQAGYCDILPFACVADLGLIRGTIFNGVKVEFPNGDTSQRGPWTFATAASIYNAYIAWKEKWERHIRR